MERNCGFNGKGSSGQVEEIHFAFHCKAGNTAIGANASLPTKSLDQEQPTTAAF